ncbi:hypothetical protein M8C13_00610 [Crossiella sp. SN42]|uniref:hypothetical protein n=1 Tax=Crossiella sp. SN42 TaxID=2944808 RepID=UPI00207D3E2B|nr:hypothetical protein [Crossiella sp. SN42]MCO1574258.1 hypothetical protein [Crossiella sp. SN42]
MEAGDTIAGRYRLLVRIGAGGMGVVWRAMDRELGREVAVEHALVDDARRLETEARTAASLAHPHIVTVYDMVVGTPGAGR